MEDSNIPMPVNVRLVDIDGNEYPVDMKYVGVDDEGIHIWAVVAYPPGVDYMGAHIDVLPAKCSVVV